MFNLINILIILKHWCLKVQILDQITSIINKWLHDSHLNCTPNVDLKDYVKAEICLAYNNYELIGEVEYFEEMQVDED